MKKKSLGLIISEIRKELGLSLEDIAKKTDLHRTTIGLIEREEREPTVTTASKIAEALNTTLPELLLLQESVEKTSKILTKRTINNKCIRNEKALERVGLNANVLLSAIEHCYDTLDLLDTQLVNNGTDKMSNLVEYANLSSIVGNILGAGLAEHSNGVFIRNKPHTYPDLIREDGNGEGLEIKVALEKNSPKGHLPKEGYYITFRYVLTDSDGQLIISDNGKLLRGDTVTIWEVKCDYLNYDDFSVSNTDGDSGKTAPFKRTAQNKMKLVYFDPNNSPFIYSDSLKNYPGFN